jgi:hypothetical protein
MVSIVLPESLHVYRCHPGKQQQQQHLQRGGPNARACSLRNMFTKQQDDSHCLAQRNWGLCLVNAVRADELAMHHRRIPEKKKGKRVSFNLEANQVLLFAVFVDPTPSIDLWWSREEMNSSQREGKLDAVVKESAHEYCRAYDRAHRQVHTVRKLTTANLGDVVKGLALGYQGLEHYSTSTAQRKQAIRSHALSVIAFQRDNKIGSDSLGWDDSSHHSCSGSSRSSRSTVNTHSTTHHINLARMVRYHSAKLSAGDRHFAAAMGKAHHMAATWANDEKHACTAAA